MPSPTYTTDVTDKQVLENLEEKIHIYQAISQGFLDEESDIYKNNDVTFLLSSNMASHPDLPIGYYDELDGNVLKVRDSLNNNTLIRKDNSVLLTNGLFTSAKSLILLNLERLNRTDKCKLFLAKRGYSHLVKEFTEKPYFIKKEISNKVFYRKFNLDDFEFVIDSSNYSQILTMGYYVSMNYLHHTIFNWRDLPTPTRESLVQLSTWVNSFINPAFSSSDNFLDTDEFSEMSSSAQREQRGVYGLVKAAIHNGYLKAKSDENFENTTFKIPETDSFLPGVTISANLNSFENGTFRQRCDPSSLIPEERRPIIPLGLLTERMAHGSQDNGFFWKMTSSRFNFATDLIEATTPVQFEGITTFFKLRFVPQVPVQVQVPSSVGSVIQGLNVKGLVKRKTDNNDGMILSYNTRVDRIKTSFAMTEAEKRVYSRIENDFKERVSEHNKKIVELTKELNALGGGTEYNTLLQKLEDLKKEAPRLHAEDRPIFMGFELEVVARNPDKETIYRSSEGVRKLVKEIADSPFGDFTIMKSDSSIGQYGFEIVSSPATLAFHREMIEKHFFGKGSNFSKKLLSTESCGFHVHISKNCFTPMDLAKLIQFINCKENAKFVNLMAGREENAYCRKVEVSSGGASKVVKDICKDKKITQGFYDGDIPHDNMMRRVAVNLVNAKTVELRLFKSTNSKNNLIRKLEFSESLVKFVRKYSMQEMTVYHYIEFLLGTDTKHDYPHIIRWLASKDMIGHEVKRVKGTKVLTHIYNVNKVPNPKPSKKVTA